MLRNLGVFNNLSTFLRGSLDSIQYGKKTRLLRTFHIGAKTVKRV